MKYLCQKFYFGSGICFGSKHMPNKSKLTCLGKCIWYIFVLAYELIEFRRQYMEVHLYAGFILHSVLFRNLNKRLMRKDKSHPRKRCLAATLSCAVCNHRWR